MQTKEEARTLAQAQTALDQMWGSVELLMPFVQKLSENGVPEDLPFEYRDVAHLCCQIIHWELVARVMSRDQYLRCKVVEPEDYSGEVKIAVKSKDGEVYFGVEAGDIQEIDGSTVIRIKAHRSIKDTFSCFLEGDRLLVPESEIICEA